MNTMKSLIKEAKKVLIELKQISIEINDLENHITKGQKEDEIQRPFDLTLYRKIRDIKKRIKEIL